MQKYAFVDRDGTILWEPKRASGADPRLTLPLKSPKEVRFMDGAIEELKKLVEKKYKLILVTNQTFLGTEKHPQKIFDETMEQMNRELSDHSIEFEFVMVCPHGPDEGCTCRKPKIGGLDEFLEKNRSKMDFSASLMFGDRDTDRQFAENLGVRFIKIETNKRFELPADLA